MDTVRLRVEFEDRHILSKSQRSERLIRSWLLLKPLSQETISDLSSYLLDIFDLYHSCPNGLILSMDGFVLPPFESTCILKDKDVISVKRKRELLSEIVEVSDGINLTEEDEIEEKQPVLTNVPLLANEEFEKETGGYQSEPEEEEDNQSEDELHVEISPVSKKRKASKKLQSSKKKIKRHKDLQDVENGFHKEQQEGCEHRPGKSMDKKKKQKESDVKSKTNAESAPSTVQTNDDMFECSPTLKRSGQLEENGVGCNNITQTPDGTRKVSRSSRRKKARRQWLREKVKAEKNEVHEMQSPEKDEQEKDTLESSLQDLVQIQEREADNEICEIVEDDKIVPIVIRPGHIRFEPLEEDQAVQQNKVYVETFKWNGITSKKKGQKWGAEKLPYRRNDYKESNKEHSEMTTAKKLKPPIDPIDFDKLAPFTGSPKEGDVIAYRLLELSSTWTPELSSFRVGKTSWYDPVSGKVLLTPVPEHPIIFEKLDEDPCSEQPDNSLYREDGSLEEQPNNSLYGEDGSLEIDFLSLVDVRIVKLGISHSAKAVTSNVNNGSTANEASTSTVVPFNNDKQTDAPTPGKEGNEWDEISQALSAKKEQLIRENGWSKEGSGKGSWSYRALRSSALGPTMAILRARNDI
ncbi:hypothetical protein RHSIM_Rhsim12G0039400 [Rhododendron simsii]|uniref:Coilin n=1 Tax=Rhododendron simsii TaxID=118357 RepID=A0A834G730_RHOSS|nr:hypothetical protein RHSIM_Rhsim12G0039400 [Rhododendron simsii]